ncbi:hypothetical protein [Pseudomonas sp. St316]|uniref:hypothetical protein n=1 Tax=Pseudomonas sp. St316 TaxID=2678257 RepID=UPI001BEF22BB|nr:hypothetical protein [Pseudomonas sp. St316]BBP60347.1 hypothetical protein PHLH4_39370 [Pseudomonas sp. St316]
MPWYKTGTVSVTLNSNAVTGTGTAFIVNCRVGDAFRGPDGRWYEVTNVASNTAISIDPPYMGATASGGSYALAPMQGYVKDSADALRAIVNTYGAQLAALKTTGNYDLLPVNKGGTGITDLSAFMQGMLNDQDAAAGRATLGAAKSGANPDITSLTGLTTPLSIAQGGTGSINAYGLGQATSVPISISDLDSPTLLTGMYSVVTATGGTRGLPYGTYNLWVNRFNSSTLAGQIAINVTTGTMYTRESQTVSFVDRSSVGVGQSWTDLTSSRAIGTTYTNTTGRPIQLAGVAGPASGAATTIIVTVGSMAVYGNYSGVAGNYLAFPMVIIPPGRHIV